MKHDQLSEEEIFEAAFALESLAARNDYLKQVCRDDEQIERIEALLKEGGPDSSFLEKGPAALQKDDDRPADLPDRIGDFEILGELGRGGMGVVYRARQCSLNRLVALKVLSPGLGLTTRATMRFKLEAEAAARLHHTNIVPIYSTGEEKRVPYYAMELIDGPSLDRVITQLRAQADTPAGVSGSDMSQDQHVPDWITKTLICLSSEEGKTATSTDTSSLDSSSSFGSESSYYDNLAEMMADVANALAHAHDQGIVHRDIKPANLLLSSDGRLSINDFGLARMLEQPGMTMTGELMGSPMYMSPEQITAGRLPLDHRTDIYSLGASLYELLTLMPPFPGQQRDQVLSQVIHKDPRKPRSINPRIPRDLETICLKAMEKDPDRRYQTAEQMAKDLRCFVNRHSISARRTSPLEKGIRWVRRNKAISAMACLAVVVCLGSVGFTYVQDRAHKRDSALNEALEKAMSGKFKEAKQRVKVAIGEGADEHWEPMIDALQAQFVGNAAHAVETLKQIVEEDPHNLTAKWMLAKAYVENGEWKPFTDMVRKLDGQYPDRPEERVFAGSSLAVLEPQKSIELLSEVLDEKPQLVTARGALAYAKVFQAIDAKDGNSKLADEALDELRTAAGLLREEEAPGLAGTRLYAHVTKAYLDFVRKGNHEQAQAYLKTYAKSDVDILARYPEYLRGSFVRLYYYQFTHDFDGMYGVMENVIDHRHRGWVSDPFWATCLMEPEWVEWNPEWKYSSPLEMLDEMPDDLQLNLSRAILQLFSRSGKDGIVAEQREIQKFFKELSAGFEVGREPAGVINDVQLIEEAGDSERKLCEAYFRIGIARIAQGDGDGAKDIFQNCANGTMYCWTHYHWSRALLDRLNQAPEKPHRLSPPEDSPQPSPD